MCASAVAAVLNKLVDSNGFADSNGNSNKNSDGIPLNRILFHARGGDLSVEMETIGKEIKRVYLIGPAEDVFTGKIRVKKISR